MQDMQQHRRCAHIRILGFTSAFRGRCSSTALLSESDVVGGVGPRAFSRNHPSHNRKSVEKNERASVDGRDPIFQAFRYNIERAYLSAYHSIL